MYEKDGQTIYRDILEIEDAFFGGSSTRRDNDGAASNDGAPQAGDSEQPATFSEVDDSDDGELPF